MSDNIIVISNESEAAAPKEQGHQGSEDTTKQSASAQEEIQEQDESTEESETSENQADQEESEGEESEESQDQEKEEKSKSHKGVAKKIGKLTKRLSMKDQEIEALRSELAKHSKPATETSQKSEEAISAEGKPTPNTFETYEEYLDALTDWKVEQKDKAKEEKLKADQRKTEQQKTVDAHLQREKDFAEKNPEYKEVVTEFMGDLQDTGVQVSLALEHLIVTSDMGPQVVLELAKNPDEFQRLNGLEYGTLAREIGKLEARLTKTSESKPEKKITNAPKPIVPVNTKGSSVVKKSIYDPDISQAEYERLRRQQQKRA